MENRLETENSNEEKDLRASGAFEGETSKLEKNRCLQV